MKKFFKQIMALLLMCALCLTPLAGCNNNSDDPNTPPDPNPPGEETELDIEKEYVVDPVETVDGMEVYTGINEWIAPYEFGSYGDITVPDGRDIGDVVGAVNWGGKYNFTDLPYLREGAEMVSKDLGSSVYKFSLAPNYATMYPYNHEWDSSSLNSMVDLARTEDYRAVFGNENLKTYVMITYEFDTCSWEGVPAGTLSEDEFAAQLESVTKEFQDLTEYLLANYYDEEKVFILSTWEGDNALGPVLDLYEDGSDEEDLAIEAFTRYLNARQDGINAAHENAQLQGSKAKVYGCVEVCHISQDISEYVPNRPRVTEVVVPNTYSDLYSFSNWYTGVTEKDLSTELDILDEAAPNPNPDFEGKKNIILGEFGFDEITGNDPATGTGGDANQLKISSEILKEAVEWGVQYACYWAFYCNQRNSTESGSSRPTNEEMSGWWMIRPDGTYSSMFWHVKGLIDNKNYLAKTPKISLVTPEEGKPVEWDANNVIFVDDLSDTSKMKDHTPVAVGVDDPQDPTDYETWGLNFVNPLQRSVFMDFTNYFETYDPTGFNRPLLNDEAFISYDVLSTKFGFFMYNYDGAGAGLARIEGKTASGEWERVSGVVYLEYRVAAWGQTYVSVEFEEGQYTELRIVLGKTSNAWDPIISKVVFFYDGEGTNPNPVDPCPDHSGTEEPPEYVDPDPEFDPTFNPSADALIDWETAKDKIVFIDDLIDDGRMESRDNIAFAELGEAHLGTQSPYFAEGEMDYSVAGRADAAKVGSMVYRARTNRIGVLAAHYAGEQGNAIKLYGSVNGVDGWEELPTYYSDAGEFSGGDCIASDPNVNMHPVYVTSVFDTKYAYVKVEVNFFQGGDAFHPSVQRVMFFMGPEPAAMEDRDWGDNTYTAADLLDWSVAKDLVRFTESFDGEDAIMDDFSFIKAYDNMMWSAQDMAQYFPEPPYDDTADSSRIMRAAAEEGYIIFDNKSDLMGLFFYVEHPISVMEKQDIGAYFKIEGMKDGEWVDLTSSAQLAEQIPGSYFYANYATLDTSGCSYIRITFTAKGYADPSLADVAFNNYEQMINKVVFF